MRCLPDKLLNQRRQHRGSAVRLAVTAVVSAIVTAVVTAVVAVRRRSTVSTECAEFTEQSAVVGRSAAARTAATECPLILSEHIRRRRRVAGVPVPPVVGNDALSCAAAVSVA